MSNALVNNKKNNNTKWGLQSEINYFGKPWQEKISFKKIDAAPWAIIDFEQEKFCPFSVPNNNYYDGTSLIWEMKFGDEVNIN